MAVGHGRGNGNRGNHRPAVGFKNIRTHAGDIADIVADVIGDNAGVARIVFGYAGLNLADEVSTDISAFRVDSAADTREQRNAGSAHAETVYDMSGMRIPAEHQIEYSQSQQADGGDCQTHNRAAVEGDGQGR